MKIVTIKIKSDTTPEQLNDILTNTFIDKNKIQLNWDLTGLNFLNLNKILLIKPVLENHRPSIKKYLDYSIIITEDSLFKNIISYTLPFLKPEKPVKILSPSEVEEHSPEYPQLPEKPYLLPYQIQEDHRQNAQ